MALTQARETRVSDESAASQVSCKRTRRFALSDSGISNVKVVLHPQISQLTASLDEPLHREDTVRRPRLRKSIPVTPYNSQLLQPQCVHETGRLRRHQDLASFGSGESARPCPFATGTGSAASSPSKGNTSSTSSGNSPTKTATHWAKSSGCSIAEARGPQGHGVRRDLIANPRFGPTTLFRESV